MLNNPKSIENALILILVIFIVKERKRKKEKKTERGNISKTYYQKRQNLVYFCKLNLEIL